MNKISTFIKIIIFILIIILDSSIILANESVIQKEIESSITKLNDDIDESIKKSISKSVLKYSKTHNIKWDIIISIIHIESNFNPKAKYRSCYGLMQINYSSHKKLLSETKTSKQMLFNIDKNISIGCIILKNTIINSKSLHYALKKYSGGSKTYTKKIYKSKSKIKGKKYASMDGKSKNHVSKSLIRRTR